jgi:hypothetical protein
MGGQGPVKDGQALAETGQEGALSRMSATADGRNQVGG